MDTAQKEEPQDFGPGAIGAAARLVAEIRAYEKACEKWWKRSEKIEKRYLDERPEHSTDRRMNLLWSNVETLKPAIYAQVPKPEVSRRFKDRAPVARLASQILERALSYSLDSYDFDAAVRDALHDRLLPGRGTAWVRYDSDGYTESAPCDYVHWKDFGHTPARVWGEVNTVWRKVYLTRAQLRARFGDKIGNAVPLDHKPKEVTDDSDGPDREVFAKATVYEMWHKPEKAVYWIHKTWSGDNGPLDMKPDPLGLRDFWPCPKPMLGTTSTKSLIPVPDYALYQDQAQEIDDLTAKIDKLTDALRVVGVYDSSQDGVQRMLNEGVDNQLIPVSNWAGFSEKGGLKGTVDFMPLTDVLTALKGAYEAREAAKQDLYEVTGISDILRGASEASETATAQGIKAQWGSMRVRERQRQVQEFARDLIRIKAEIIAEHFAPETLAAMVSVQSLTDNPQEFAAAVQLLRDDRLRGFQIDIETDSTIEPDENAEKQARVEFLNASGNFLKQALEVASVAPELTPMVSEMMLFGVRGFRAGRQLETVIEESLEAAQQAAMQKMQNPQPDPKVMEAQANLKLQAEKQKADQALKAQGMQSDAALEKRGQDIDAALKMREQNLHAQVKVADGRLP